MSLWTNVAALALPAVRTRCSLAPLASGVSLESVVSLRTAFSVEADATLLTQFSRASVGALESRVSLRSLRALFAAWPRWSSTLVV